MHLRHTIWGGSLAAALLTASIGAAAPALAAPDDIVAFASPELQACANRSINTSSGANRPETEPITEADALNIINLDCTNQGVDSLSGLEYALNMDRLLVSYNTGITSVEPILQIPALEAVFLAGIPGLMAEGLPDWSGNPKLSYLNVSGTTLPNLDGIGTAPLLEDLLFEDNEVSDLSPLRDLLVLDQIWFSRNHVRDIQPLRELPKLYWIEADQNHILDLSGLNQDMIEYYQVYNQTWWLPPIRVGAEYPSPLIAVDGSFAPLNLGMSETVLPSADASSWHFDEVAMHPMWWQSDANPGWPSGVWWTYFGGKILQPAYQLTNPDDRTHSEGEDTSFSGVIDYPTAEGEAEPTLEWEVSTDGGTTWTVVPGAGDPTLSLTGVTVAGNDGNLFRQKYTVPGFDEPLYGEPALLTVTKPAVVPPTEVPPTEKPPTEEPPAEEPPATPLPSAQPPAPGAEQLANTGATVPPGAAALAALTLLAGGTALLRRRNRSA